MSEDKGFYVNDESKPYNHKCNDMCRLERLQHYVIIQPPMKYGTVIWHDFASPPKVKEGTTNE